MNIYRAPLPLSEADFLDFLYNYFKAEYEPIRSIFWSTATAVPKDPQRWIAMGHELSPTSFRPANPRTQADLQSLDYLIRKWNLDPTFVRGIVIRYSKYELHERLDKKLWELGRLDLMVRKALKEKHLIDALWPSPAPKNLPHEVLKQIVQVRRWYGDMFTKYFRMLHAVDDFEVKPEIDFKGKNSQLMLVPFVDHLVSGTLEPIRPIVAKIAGFEEANIKTKEVASVGEPDRFEIRFDSPGDVQNTIQKTFVRQCQCSKCGSRRDVHVVLTMDPTPGGALLQSKQNRPSSSNTPASRRQHSSKVAQKYTPGYNMPGLQDAAPRHELPAQIEPRDDNPEAPSPSPVHKKQCPKCTLLNHPDLSVCEVCESALPDTLVSKPPSPVNPVQREITRATHGHSSSMPPNTRTDELKKDERPAMFSRHSISSNLFSYLPSFPFPLPAEPAEPPVNQTHNPVPHAGKGKWRNSEAAAETTHSPQQKRPAPLEIPARESSSAQPQQATPPPDDDEPSLSRHPESVMMALTPPPVSETTRRATPLGMPQNLMDDYVPVTPPYTHEDDENAGWGDVSREEAREEEHEEEDDVVERKGGMLDLDAVAREEMGVWGEKDED